VKKGRPRGSTNFLIPTRQVLGLASWKLLPTEPYPCEQCYRYDWCNTECLVFKLYCSGVSWQDLMQKVSGVRVEELTLEDITQNPTTVVPAVRVMMGESIRGFAKVVGLMELVAARIERGFYTPPLPLGFATAIHRGLKRWLWAEKVMRERGKVVCKLSKLLEELKK